MENVLPKQPHRISKGSVDDRAEQKKFGSRTQTYLFGDPKYTFDLKWSLLDNTDRDSLIDFHAEHSCAVQFTLYHHNLKKHFQVRFVKGSFRWTDHNAFNSDVEAKVETV